MEDKLYFSRQEREETVLLYNKIKKSIGSSLIEGDEAKMRQYLRGYIERRSGHRDTFDLNPILLGLQTANIVVEEIGLRRDAVLAILLHPCVEVGFATIDQVRTDFGESVALILHGLQRIQELYKKNPAIVSENFRNLLLSFAEDMRVILIMIADRVNLMRQIRDIMADTSDDELSQARHEAGLRVSEEAAYLYAPLAHKLGLYHLKSHKW